MDAIPGIDSIVEFIKSIPEAAVFVVVGILDFVFRLVKTDKPKSIAWLVQKSFEQLSRLFGALAEFLDKILPQKLNE